MTAFLAHIVAQAHVQSLSLVGLAKNVGKTTTTNHLLKMLPGEKLYRTSELALTSLGLDGETIDALTALPKPRYVPEAGLIIATASDLLRQAESEEAQVEYLALLPGRTALGPVILARVVRPGRIIIAGPTLLRDVCSALERMRAYGTRLAIIDGAINRLGAASPNVTDACIVCTGASAGATLQIAARRTADLLLRLATQQTKWIDVYRNNLAYINAQRPEARLLTFSVDYPAETPDYFLSLPDPAVEAEWIVERLLVFHQKVVFLLRGAFTEELSRELLARLSPQPGRQAELVVGDATKIFCHSAVLQRLVARGLHVRVAHPIRVLAISINPYTPEYQCTAQQLFAALVQELPAERPPILDVVSGLRG